MRIPTFAEAIAASRSRGRMTKSPHLWDGLMAHYSYLEGGGKTLYDLGGSDNSGALTNMNPATDWVVTEKGWALDLKDDANQHVVIAANAALLALPTTYNFTASFWFQADSSATDHAGLAWEGTDDVVLYPNDNIDGGGGWRVFWRDLGGNIISENTGGMAGEWHLATFVSRASNLHEVYRDGVLEGTSSDTGAAGPFSNLYIGTFTPTSQHFDGRIGPVSIWDRALARSEIGELYADPHALVRLRPRVIARTPAAPAGIGGSPLRLESALQGAL